MTATNDQQLAPVPSVRRRLVWPWAVVSGLVGAFVAALVLLMLGLKDTGVVIGAVAGGVITALAAFPLAARARLRIGILAGAVMLAVAWAAAFYLDGVYVYRASDGAAHALPWTVNGLKGWQILAVPLGLAAFAALAVSAVVLLQRRSLVHAGRWAAALGASLVISLIVRALMEGTRVYLR